MTALKPPFELPIGSSALLASLKSDFSLPDHRLDKAPEAAPDFDAILAASKILENSSMFPLAWQVVPIDFAQSIVDRGWPSDFIAFEEPQSADSASVQFDV